MNYPATNGRRSINRNFYFALWDGELTHVPLCGIKREHFFNSDSIHIKSDSLYSNSNNTIAISKLHSIELVDRIDGLMHGVPIAIGVTITSFYLGLSWDAYIDGEISYLVSVIVGIMNGHNKVFLFNNPKDS